jgi:hypothetical protein
MTKTNQKMWVAKSMVSLVFFAGVLGIAFQFFGDLGDLAILALAPATLGGLVASSAKFDERDQQLLSQASSRAFGWLLFVLLVAYAFVEISEWLGLAHSAVVFLNARWPGFTISFMCLLLGIAGLSVFREESRLILD